MKSVLGNIWDYHKKGNWIVITTNGYVKKDGLAVMGRGVALEAKNRFPELPKILGLDILKAGNIVHCYPKFKIITFPVKHNWWEMADLNLIRQSCERLVVVADRVDEFNILAYKTEIYMVRPGCGNGQLYWSQVRPITAPILKDDRFIMVERIEDGN